MMVQRRRAHAGFACQSFKVHGLGVVVANPLNRREDMVGTCAELNCLA